MKTLGIILKALAKEEPVAIRRSRIGVSGASGSIGRSRAEVSGDLFVVKLATELIDSARDELMVAWLGSADDSTGALLSSAALSIVSVVSN